MSPLKYVPTTFLFGVLVLLFPASALAQKNDYFDRTNLVYLEFNFGSNDPDDNSDIYDFLENESTFDRDDLDGFAFDFKVYYQLNNRISLGGAVTAYEEDTTVENLDFVDINGRPIFNTTTLDTTWIGGQIIWTPFGAGETFGTRGWAPKFFVPYLSAGVGFKVWEFHQDGEFVDQTDPNDPFIFADRFESDGEAFSTRLGAGFRLNLHKNVDLNFQLQRDWGEDDLEGSFIGFGELDLGSQSGFVGVTIRL